MPFQLENTSFPRASKFSQGNISMVGFGGINPRLYSYLLLHRWISWLQHIGSLCCTPETNKMFYVNEISIKKKNGAAENVSGVETSCWFSPFPSHRLTFTVGKGTSCLQSYFKVLNAPGSPRTWPPPCLTIMSPPWEGVPRKQSQEHTCTKLTKMFLNE